MFDPLSPNGVSPFASTSDNDAAPWSSTPLPPNGLNPTSGGPNGARAPVAPIPKPSDLYSKEPKIYGQQEPGLISPDSNKLSNGHKIEKLEPYLRIRITALDRNRRDILIRFDAQASPPSPAPPASRFSDRFCNVGNRPICQTSTAPHIEASRAPTPNANASPIRLCTATRKRLCLPFLSLKRRPHQMKKVSSRSYAILAQRRYSFGPRAVDDRLIKIMLQRWLTRISEDPVLMRDEETRSFVEADFGVRAIHSVCL